MRNFRNLDIWKNAVQLAKQVYLLTAKLPGKEKYGLCSQLQRASVSIPSNIAEGSARKSEADFARYLEMALGSAFEVETQLIIAKDVDYISEKTLQTILSDLHKLQKQINQLISKIRR